MVDLSKSSSGAPQGLKHFLWHGALLLGGIALTGVVLLAGWVAWLALQDPLAALPRAEGRLTFERESQVLRDDRLDRRMVFSDPTLKEVRATISLPAQLPGGPMPVIIVLGGMRTGIENIRPIQNAGDNVLIGYDWPLPADVSISGGLNALSFDMRDRALSVPGQVEAILSWLDGQPWADTQRVSLLGYSLGAMVAPSVQRVLAEAGHRVGWTVLAYGGTDLGDIVAANPHLRPDWAKPLLGLAADRLLIPLEPAEHLAHLQGRFLLLDGSADRIIPAASAARLRTLTPEPKTAQTLEGDHMSLAADQARLLAEIIGRSRSWLATQGAVNGAESAVISSSFSQSAPAQ